jgi:hypothetical protein
MAAQCYGQGNFISHADYMSKNPQSFANIPFISGHFGYDYAKPLMNGRKSFTFLRDPIERILSFYSFCLTRKPEEWPIYRLAQSLDFTEFLKFGLEIFNQEDEKAKVRWMIWNNQVWNLAYGHGNTVGISMDDLSPDALLAEACRNAHHFDFVGFAEDFADDSAKVAAMLNWQVPDTHKNHRVNVTQKRLKREDLSSSEMALLTELTQLDSKLYEYVKRELRPDLRGEK